MFWWVSWTLSRHTPVNQMLSNKQRHFLMSRGRHFLDLPLTIKCFPIYVRALMTLTMHKRMRFSLKEHSYFYAPVSSQNIHKTLKLRYWEDWIHFLWKRNFIKYECPLRKDFTPIVHCTRFRPQYLQDRFAL